jgi:hypothetical protein
VPGRYVILGPGLATCDTWLVVRRDNGFGKAWYEDWLLGYVSAYNTFVAPSGDVSAGLESDELLGRVDHYCEAHRQDGISRAAEALVRTLSSEKPRAG